MIVTEGGKNVYPEEIENRFQLFEEMDQVLIRGYMMDKKMRAEGIEALIYPSEDYFKAYFTKRGKTWELQEIKERIEELVSKVNDGLLPYQRITKTVLLDKPMEMTTTKKIKRFAMDMGDEVIST
jgi:long-chain acyl-CoA synthetase